MLLKGQKVILKSSKETGVISQTQVDKNKGVIVKVGDVNRILSQSEVLVIEEESKAVTKTWPAFITNDRVKIQLSNSSFFFGTVSKTSLTSNSLVEIKTGARDPIEYHKDKVTLVPKTYEMMYLDKTVLLKVNGKEVEGKVHAFSPATEEKVKVKVPEHGIVTVAKSQVREKPPYVAPKEYFKDFKKKTEDLELMAKLFQATTHSAVCELAMQDIGKDYKIIEDSEYTALIPKGLKATDKLPCLIAHTDLHPSLTHPTADNLEFDGNIFKSATGLGADDRAGVFAIAKLLKSHPKKFMVLFPDKEEVGLIGSKKFGKSKDFLKMDKHTSVFISIDRRREVKGDKTIATYDSDNKDLNTWVSKLTDRKVVNGSSTDCKALSTASLLNVPCFNMSCGYTSEHTKYETLRFDELLVTIEDLGKVLDDKRINKTYKFEEKTYGYYNSGNTNKSYNNKKQDLTPSVYGMEGYIELDNEWFFEDDLTALLNVYHYYTGEDYVPTSDANYVIPTLDSGDQVRLDNTMAVGKIYGGQVFTADIKRGMSNSLWEVDGVNKDGTLELIGVENVRSTSSNIPRRWVTLVTDDSPIVID